MNRLITLSSEMDIPARYRSTPIGDFICYHNFGKDFPENIKAELLIGMCMDNRKNLRIPDNYAYILRSGGGNLRFSEFKLSYAIAIGGIKAIVLLAHNNCGMVNLISRKDLFVQGLVENGGWSNKQAEEHFWHFAPMFEIGNETDFVLSEAKRLRLRYPRIHVAPLFYKIDDNLLYAVTED